MFKLIIIKIMAYYFYNMCYSKNITVQLLSLTKQKPAEGELLSPAS